MNEPPAHTEGWVDLCALEDVPDEGGTYVTLNERALAVFRTGPQQIRIIDDACPHAGGSLSRGYLQDNCVVCPWHEWAFNIQDGRCPDNPTIKVQTHLARIETGRVWVKIND